MRRFGVVRHIADLFDRYGVHRPDMVRAWVSAAMTDDDWQPSCGGACARGSAPRVRPSGSPRRASASAATRVARPPRTAVAVRADANPALLPRRAGRDRGASAICTCSCSTHRPSLWASVAEELQQRPTDHEPARGPDRGSGGQPAARVLGPRRPRAPARARERRRRRPTTITSCPRPKPRRCSRGSRPTSARTASQPGPPLPGRVRRPASPAPRPTEPSRSTPATAARARSRSSATWSSTCSRTTRRSSRAT